MTTEQLEGEEGLLSSTFVISPEKLESQGRSLGLLLRDRRCAACWGGLMQETAGGMEIPWEDHLEKIAGHCSKNKDFIQPGLPMMEAVFRTLLANGNQPTSLEEVLEVLQKQWSDSSSHWAPPPAKLHRMLSRDVFYGITVATPATPE